MLSMTEIKIKEEVKGMERELLEVGRMIVEEEAIRREKIAGCNAAREMHEAQVSNILIITTIAIHLITLVEATFEDNIKVLGKRGIFDIS